MRGALHHSVYPHVHRVAHRESCGIPRQLRNRLPTAGFGFSARTDPHGDDRGHAAEGVWDQKMDEIPMGRAGEVAEIASVALRLLESSLSEK